MEFVHTIENVMSKELCKEIIEKYEKDTRKTPAKLDEGIIDNDIRKNSVLYINDLEDWRCIDEQIYKCVSRVIGEYIERTKIVLDQDHPPDILEEYLDDDGYHIQSYEEGDFYNWHHDELVKDRRCLTVMFYLNDMKEEDGGTTDFRIGGPLTSIVPKEGMSLIFPSNWCYMHRAGVVKNNAKKYTIITWIKIRHSFITNIPSINV